MTPRWAVSCWRRTRRTRCCVQCPPPVSARPPGHTGGRQAGHADATGRSLVFSLGTVLLSTFLFPPFRFSLQNYLYCVVLLYVADYIALIVQCQYVSLFFFSHFQKIVYFIEIPALILADRHSISSFYIVFSSEISVLCEFCVFMIHV